jgi:hypothetical protein
MLLQPFPASLNCQRKSNLSQAHECAGFSLHPPQLNYPWIRPLHALTGRGSLLLQNCGVPVIAQIPDFEMRCRKGKRPPTTGERPDFDQSCSFRAFFRLRLRAKASFTRFFSPGFR